MPDSPNFDLPEIAAGAMQLQPVDEDSLCGAIAALGRQVRTAHAVWVARDAVTANPVAYVAIVGISTEMKVVAAPGIVGNDDEAADAANVVRRFAHDGLGLSVA